MAGLKVWTPSGRQVVDTESSVALILDVVTIGGGNQAQSGVINDARLVLGRPFYLVTTLEVNGFIGYRPEVTFGPLTVSWRWPQNSGDGQGGTLAFPRCRFIYGLR